MTKRIEKINPETLTGEPRRIFERWSPDGKPLNIVLTYFRNVELNRNWSYMATHLFMKNSLAARQRETIVLRTSWQCASDYEFIQHVYIARMRNLLSDEEMRDLTKKELQLEWPKEERALVAAADELLASHGVNDATWEVLESHFDEKQLMDIIATAGGYTLNSMATGSFGVGLEDMVTREEGLSPTSNGPAFHFAKTDRSIAALSAPRIAPTSLEILDEKTRASLVSYLESGDRSALLNTIARYPGLLKDWAPIIRYVDNENTLAPQERATVGLRAAVQCRSATVFADRAASARRAGVAPALMDSLKSTAPQVESDPRRALLVSAVDQLIDDKIIGDALWDRMKAHFSDEELMDVVFATATELMICWMQNALGVQYSSEQESDVLTA